MSKSIRSLMLVMALSLVIALFWNSVPAIKDSVHFILDPTAGKLLDWNIDFGMILFAAIISFFLTIVQKYTTDQKTLREIKKEQKILQEEMKNFKDNPQKLLELQKKQLEFIPRTLEITMRPIIYTSVPIILFIRWFGDYFVNNPVKIFGFLGWIWAYIIFSIIFSTIFRKLLNVV